MKISQVGKKLPEVWIFVLIPREHSPSSGVHMTPLCLITAPKTVVTVPRATTNALKVTFFGTAAAP